MAVGEIEDAVEVGPGIFGLLIRRDGIERQHLVGVFAEHAADLLLVVLPVRLFEEDEGACLQRVEALQAGLFVVDAPAVGFIRGLGEDIAVDRDMVVDVGRCGQAFGIHPAQLGNIRGVEALKRLVTGLFRLVQQTEGMRRQRRGNRGALTDGAAEQAPGKRRGAERTDTGRAGRLAGDGHVIRVAAEGRDIRLHPLQRLDLVQKAVVAGGAVGRLGRQLVGREEAEDPEAVAHVDREHALAGKTLAAVIGVPGLAGLEGTAVDEDQNRQILLRTGGLPDIQVEGILGIGLAEVVVQRDLIIMKADDLRERIVDRGIARLHGHGREGVGFQDAVPGLGILRLAPAQIPHGRSSIGNAGIDLDRFVGCQDTGQLSVRHRDDVGHAAVWPLDSGTAFHRADRQVKEQAHQQHQAEEAGNAHEAALL